jgi:hypothetical protein
MAIRLRIVHACSHGRVKKRKKRELPYLWDGETLRPRRMATFTYSSFCCCCVCDLDDGGGDDDEVFLLMVPRLTILMQALMTPTIFSPHSATYTKIYIH